MLRHQVGDFFDQVGFVDLIGNFGNDDLFFAVLELLDIGLGADIDASAAGAIGIADAVAAVDDAAGREIGTGDVLEQ